MLVEGVLPKRKECNTMATSNKNSHLTADERIIIQCGIENNSSKKSIADTLGKDKSTICKEIKLHRTLSYKSKYTVECLDAGKCPNKYTHYCSKECPAYKPFVCKRRDRSPGACNGCDIFKKCRYNKYLYDANDAQDDYLELLVGTRSGVNASVEEIRNLGLLIKPLIDKGQSLYVICNNHPEINVTERTLYSYIEDGVFQDAGVSITNLDLKRKVRRKMSKKKAVKYAKRKDRTYLKGRTYTDYQNYMEENPNARIVEMDTVYNDVQNGPFIQTFKFLQYDLLICIYHVSKDSSDMLKGINLLEQMIGLDNFNSEVEVLLTDRGSEFVAAEEAEIRTDGSRRTRMYYCDSMSSWQKGSLENVHIMLREICPNSTDLYTLGLTSQEKANLISSHINSYPKKKLKGKTSFQLLEFFNQDMADKLYQAGLFIAPSDEVTLKSYLLKNEK